MKNGKYLVKPWKFMLDQGYKLDSYRNIRTSNASWTQEMEQVCPESRIIKVIDNTWIDSTGQTWRITPEMLVGPYFAYGDPCQFRDNGMKKWIDAQFGHYRTAKNIDFIFATTDGNAYEQIRHPEPEKKLRTIELTDEEFAKIKEILERGEI